MALRAKPRSTQSCRSGYRPIPVADPVPDWHARMAMLRQTGFGQASRPRRFSLRPSAALVLPPCYKNLHAAQKNRLLWRLMVVRIHRCRTSRRATWTTPRVRQLDARRSWKTPPHVMMGSVWCTIGTVRLCRNQPKIHHKGTKHIKK